MRVIVGLSGGVDSSVAAYLLQKRGYDVVGVTYKMLDDFDTTDASAVANSLGIEFHVEDIRKEFKNEIIDNFIDNYKNGLTPNPCVLCNEKIKFKYLYESLIKYNADFISTGHYVKVIDNELYRADDKLKDQSYFLYAVDKNILSKLIFPLSNLTKNDVRKIALDNNLITANKKDSFDVCFIKNGFKDFIEKNIDNKNGDIIDIETGKCIGKHNGLAFYTIGQRKGLNIGGTLNRMVVIKKDIDKNILYVASSNSNYLESCSCIITNVKFNTDLRPDKCTAVFRYRSPNYDVDLTYLPNNEILVKYNSIKSVTIGQSCVFYLDDRCIGGGIIKEVK